MIVVQGTTLDGLLVLSNTIHRDSRGSFKKLFSEKEFEETGLAFSIKELYYSINARNVIRGMHFQTPPFDHYKLVYVNSGRITDVCLDIRKGSKTYGKYYSIDLTSNSETYLFIPPGFAHGFISLEDGTIVNYAQSSCHAPENDKGILFNSFNYDWECDVPIISDRDRRFPSLSDFDTPFMYNGKVL